MDNKYPTGAIPSPEDKRDILFASVSAPMLNLPRKFSRRSEQSPVPGQNYGSCVGHAAKAYMEWAELKEKGEQKILSGRFPYAMAKSLDGNPGIEGTWPRVMLKVMAAIGNVLDSVFPNHPAPPTHAEYIKLPESDVIESGTAYRINGFAWVRNIQEIKEAIYQYGPVLISIRCFDTFASPEADGFCGPTKNPASYFGNHEVLAVGWDDDMHGIGAIEIKNSWTENWGPIGGYAFLGYNYDGSYPFYEAQAPLDFIDAVATQGAPVALAYPVDEPAVITQGFGANFINPKTGKPMYKVGHGGIDFRARNAAPIYAADNGEVILAGWLGDFGNCVVIKHSWGLTYYGHLSRFAVSDHGPDGRFNPVVKKQLIGYSGDSGNTVGEHLHFAGKINGVRNAAYNDYVDLSLYFKENSMSDKGFAYTMQGTNKTEVFYYKIHNPAEYEAFCLMTDLQMKWDLPSMTKIDTLPIKGFAYDKTGRCVVFYNKISTPAERDALIKMFGGARPNPLPLANNI